MDGQRFDEITRALATGANRRRVLQGLAPGALGLLGLRRAPAAAQTCPNRLCASDPGVCAGTAGCNCCVFANGNNRCLSPSLCQRAGGTVTCPAGQQFVNGQCQIVTCPNGQPPCNGGCCDEYKTCVNDTCQIVFSTTQSTARVWRALTDRDRIASWALANDFEPRVGHRFQLRTKPRAGFDGVMDAEVVEVVPERRLAFTWRGGPLQEPTTVTIHLDPDGDGTRLRLTHNTPDQSPCRAAALLLGRDWQRAMLGEALPRHLNQTRG